jgi:hypothetical protein
VLGKPPISAKAVPVDEIEGVGPAVMVVCGEGIATGEGTLAACGMRVDVKTLKVGLEVNAGAALTDSTVVNAIGSPSMELAAAWESLTLTVDMTSVDGTPEATMPCPDPTVMDIPGIATVSIVVGTPTKD